MCSHVCPVARLTVATEAPGCVHTDTISTDTIYESALIHIYVTKMQRDSISSIVKPVQ